MSTYLTYRRLIAQGTPPERTAAFSDAVFAIAMTLLVLELRVPEVAEADLGSALSAMVSQYLTFVLSFVVVGAVWMSHHRKFAALVGVDQAMLRLNLVMLLFVASLPLPTAVLGRYGDSAAAAVLYALTIVAIGFSLVGTWIYAWHRHLVRPDVTVEVFRYVLVQSFPIPGTFLLSVPVALVLGAGAAEALWIAAVPLSLLIAACYRTRRAHLGDRP